MILNGSSESIFRVPSAEPVNPGCLRRLPDVAVNLLTRINSSRTVQIIWRQLVMNIRHSAIVSESLRTRRLLDSVRSHNERLHITIDCDVNRRRHQRRRHLQSHKPDDRTIRRDASVHRVSITERTCVAVAPLLGHLGRRQKIAAVIEAVGSVSTSQVEYRWPALFQTVALIRSETVRCGPGLWTATGRQFIDIQSQRLPPASYRRWKTRCRTKFQRKANITADQQSPCILSSPDGATIIIITCLTLVSAITITRESLIATCCNTSDLKNKY